MCCYNSVVSFLKFPFSWFMLDKSLCCLCADLLNSAGVVQRSWRPCFPEQMHWNTIKSRSNNSERISAFTQVNVSGFTRDKNTKSCAFCCPYFHPALSLLTYFYAHLSSTEIKRRICGKLFKSRGFLLARVWSPPAPDRNIWMFKCSSFFCGSSLTCPSGVRWPSSLF